MDSYVIPLSAQKPKILTLVPSDPTSRYKTRQLQVQVVGKSKMIKTVLVNILDVSKDMQVPPSYIGTFMGYESAAQSKFDASKPERQQAYISGEHDTKDLSRIMLQFITEVILCPVCGLPEILYNVEGGKKVTGKCRACGGNAELPITNEKFKRYIINHPPSGTGKGEKGAFAGNKAGAKKETKKVEKGKKKDSTKKKDDEDDDEEEESDGVVWYSDTSAEAAQKRKEEMVPKSLEEKQIETEVEEVTKVLKDDNTIPDKIKLLKSHGFSDKILLSRILAAIFAPTSQDLQADVKTNQPLLAAIINTTDAQMSFLRYLETLCGTTNTALAAKFALVLKDLYDTDLVEEETVLKWSQSEVLPLIKEKATPFLKWLNEAEEESSGEEEEEED